MDETIQLFSYQDKEIRTTLHGRDVWFAAVDVFKALNLNWRGANSLETRKINKGWMIVKDSQTMGGLQEMVFIKEQAVYKLAFKANQSKQADQFTNWVAELLVSIRKSKVPTFAGIKPEDHLSTDIQKQNSKAINSKMFMDGDVRAIKEHNTINCEVHTGYKPSEVKAIGKKFGLKSKDRSSAKEVLRHMKPEFAASMSMADRLTGERNIASEVAAKTCKDLAVPLFKKLLELGAADILKV